MMLASDSSSYGNLTTPKTQRNLRFSNPRSSNVDDHHGLEQGVTVNLAFASCFQTVFFSEPVTTDANEFRRSGSFPSITVTAL
mgnify:CR=1